MTIQIFKRERFNTGVDRGDKRVIIGAKASQKERDQLNIIERMINGGKCVGKIREPVEIISNGRVAFPQGCKLIINLHYASTRVGGEHSLQSEPHITRGVAFHNMGQDGFKKGRDQGT